MRPNKLRRVLVALFAITVFVGCAAGYGIGEATADGVIDAAERSYIDAYSGAVCVVLDQFPSEAGVMGIAAGIMDDGFAADQAVDIINAAVWEVCPRHWALLERVGAEARGETPLKRGI